MPYTTASLRHNLSELELSKNSYDLSLMIITNEAELINKMLLGLLGKQIARLS